MIFLDTSAIYALADIADEHHQRASELFQGALSKGEAMLVHNYVIVEAAALIQNRLGLDSALQFLQDSAGFQLHWIGEEDHRQATEILAQRRRGGLSLVDCASFVVMRHHAVTHALAFDPDFEREGFGLYEGALN